MRKIWLLAVAAAALAADSAQEQFGRAESAIRSGDYPTALRELAAIHCAGDSAATCRARVPSMRGTALLFSGEYAGAERAFQEGLRLYRAIPDPARVADLLNNLGTVHFYRGQYAEAFERYREAQSAIAGKQSEAWFAGAAQLTAANLATLYQRLGRYREALDVYRSLGSAPAGLSAAERAQLLMNVAVLNRRLGDAHKARRLMSEARARLAAERDLEAWLGVVKNLGILLALDFGDLAAAETEFRVALTAATRAGNAREAMQAKLYLAEVRWRRRDIHLAESLWSEARAASETLQTPEDRWRALYGLARAARRQAKEHEARRLLDQCMTVIESLRGAIGAATLKTDFLADKLDPYEEALSMAAERSDPAAAFAVMERGRALVLQEALGRHTVRPELREFQSRLQPGEAALLYRLGRADSFALAVTSEEARLRPLGLDEPTAGRLVQEVRADPDGAAARHELSARLLANLPAGEVKRLWIVPDGSLALLPFEALPWKQGLVVERFEVAYLPAASLLRSAPAATGERRWPWTRQLVAYADPDMGRVKALPGDEHWGKLSRSRAEVEGIARLLPGRAELHFESQVDAQGLLRLGAGVPILHLATHGAGDAESAQRNRLVVGSGYLYGSQLRPGALAGVQLAVLSACDTEAGIMNRGEGVQSLARQFLEAGARTTVASLWKVDDGATEALMREFYGQLADGAEVAAALRAAKLRMRRSPGPLREARYWAAFVAQGAAGERLPDWTSWGQLAGGAAAGLLTIAAASWAITRRQTRSDQ